MIILSDIVLMRLIVLMGVGATLYAFEITNVFGWIERKVTDDGTFLFAIKRTALAMLYFNPIWIARHLLILALAEGRFHSIDGVELIITGVKSFGASIPAAVLGNYIIQVKLPLKYRFIGSAVFSGAMVVYYALSEVLF